ncbi:MAG: hypothetical protein WBM13_03000, partial [Bacteroidia bacterium]
ANHLGNVMVTVTDKKQGVDLGGASTDAEYYMPEVVSATDYFAYQKIMNGRTFNENAYRYGANSGNEKDDEIYGSGNAYSAEYWEYDPRLGRRWENDPIVKPWESSYATFGDNPIYYNDPNGLDKGTATKKEKEKGGTAAKGTKYSPDGNTRSMGNTTQTLNSECDCYVSTSIGEGDNYQKTTEGTIKAGLVLAPTFPSIGEAIGLTAGATIGIIVAGAVALPIATGADVKVPEHEQGDWIVYRINYLETDLTTGMPVSSGTYKYGISGQPGYKEKPGHPRPELQRNALNATEAILVNSGVVTTQFYYTYDILVSGISQLSAEFIEQELVNVHYTTHGEPPDGNKRPIPDALRGRTRVKFQKLDSKSVDKIKDFLKTTSNSK